MLFFRSGLAPWVAFASFLILFLSFHERSPGPLVVEKLVEPVQGPANPNAGAPKTSRVKVPRSNVVHKHVVSNAASTKHFPLEHNLPAGTNASNVLNKRDYSCGPGQPCDNGACCGASGICGYGNFGLLSPGFYSLWCKS
jgi:hypothetical protein